MSNSWYSCPGVHEVSIIGCNTASSSASVNPSPGFAPGDEGRIAVGDDDLWKKDSIEGNRGAITRYKTKLSDNPRHKRGREEMKRNGGLGGFPLFYVGGETGVGYLTVLMNLYYRIRKSRFRSHNLHQQVSPFTETKVGDFGGKYFHGLSFLFYLSGYKGENVPITWML
jgi:hypothetical protein